MAERDPFGRLPDENPLAALGWVSDSSESQVPPQPVRSVRASDGDEPPERPRKPPRPRAPAATGSPEATLRDLLVSVQKMKSSSTAVAPPPVARNVGRIVKTAFVVAIIIAILGGVGGLVSVSEQGTGGVSDLPSRVGVPPQAPSGNAPEPVGLGHGSLLLRRNLEPALRRMRTSGLGRLKSLSIRPARINAQLLTKDGRLRSVQQRFDGKLTSLSISGGGFGALATIPFSRANPVVPSRLARRAAARVGRGVSQVEYVAFVDSGPAAVWTVVMKGGGQFIGDARGRITRRIG
ncbi:MAG: hypothetical protein QOJ89_3662 [bacterium]|jgi:hypothetical protein